MRASRPFACAVAVLALTVTACGTISASAPGAGGSHPKPGTSGHLTLTPSPVGSSSPGGTRRHHHQGGGGRTGPVLVTGADNGRTVTLTVGQVLVVVLGGHGASSWDRPRLVEPAPGALRELSVAGGYPSTAPVVARFLAVRDGTATLTSTSDARCLHQRPKCAIPQRLWRVTVVVSG